ncbi:putative carbohydrate esterase [Glycine soja]|nr:putative carbohydrate esterase [Glycine soja]
MSKGRNKRWPLIFFIDRLCCSASITTPLQQSLRITGHGAAPPPTYRRTKRTRKQINIYCVLCVIIRIQHQTPSETPIFVGSRSHGNQHTPKPTEQTPKTKRQIFILSGQSNMAGHGGGGIRDANNRKRWDGVVPPESRPDPSILRLSATLQWELANEPLHVDRQIICVIIQCEILLSLRLGFMRHFPKSNNSGSGRETKSEFSLDSKISIRYQVKPPFLLEAEAMETNTLPNQQTPKTKRQIFILSGQSNMAGRGGVIRDANNRKRWDGVVPPESRSDPSILRLSATLQWEPANEPLHVDIDSRKACGVGPGMVFANALLRRRVVVGELGLVPCAVGGTAMKEWARGEELYENMVKRAKESVKERENSSEIKAVLWFQGESDAINEEDAAAYKVNMETLIHNVRQDLNLPSLPIIQVALASGSDYIEKVREAQKAIDLPNVICVDAKGLQLMEDNLHLTTESQIQLGHKLAEAYLTHFHA